MCVFLLSSSQRIRWLGNPAERHGAGLRSTACTSRPAGPIPSPTPSLDLRMPGGGCHLVACFVRSPQPYQPPVSAPSNAGSWCHLGACFVGSPQHMALGSFIITWQGVAVEPPPHFITCGSVIMCNCPARLFVTFGVLFSCLRSCDFRSSPVFKICRANKTSIEEMSVVRNKQITSTKRDNTDKQNTKQETKRGE